QM
ncbi:putative single-stranded DNA-binding protein, partial [Chlamydia psittaci 84-8471/1]